MQSAQRFVSKRASAEDIIAMGATDLEARLKSGELSAVEVVDVFIE